MEVTLQKGEGCVVILLLRLIVLEIGLEPIAGVRFSAKPFQGLEALKPELLGGYSDEIYSNMSGDELHQLLPIKTMILQKQTGNDAR